MTDPGVLPDPLVPAEVDLRDFQFMPLDVVRFRDCGLVSDFEAEEALAAILLWSASWHQVPASSLPDSDKQLSKLAGYGKGVRDYLKIKAGSLHGFIKCSDGLWYHGVVAEKAAEGWNAKIKEEHKRACDRQRKANKERKDRHEPELAMPAHPPLLSNVPANGIPCWRYRDSDGNELDSAGSRSGDVRNSRLKGSEGTEKGSEGKGSSSSKPPQQQSPSVGSGLSTAHDGNSAAAAASALIFPEKLSSSDTGAAAALLVDIDNPQVILDELEGIITSATGCRNAMGLLKDLIAQKRRGEFIPSHAHRIEAEREHRQIVREVQRQQA